MTDMDVRGASSSQKVTVGAMWVVLMVLMIVMLLVSGCKSSRMTSRTTSVEVEDAPSVVTQAPDTLYTPAPNIPVPDMGTLPLRVRSFSPPDTTSPSIDVTGISIVGRELRVRTRDEEVTYRTPAEGEELHARPDTSGTLQAGVSGQPTRQTLHVESSGGEVTFWARMKQAAIGIGALLILALLIRLFK